MTFRPFNTSHGFTLVELIVGIVITAIALTFLTSVFFSNPTRSVEPILQIRAAEFGQAIMEEILAKNFDENTPVGGIPPCTSCTAVTNFGAEPGEIRSTFDDVDDYHDYCDNINPSNLFDSSGNDLSISDDQFGQFRMSVCVTSGSDNNEKLITVNMYINTGSGLSSPITFTAYKGNY